MEQNAELLVVGVRFNKVGKIYHFESNGLTDLKVGDMVVVETSRGWQLGQVAQILQDAEPPPDGWKLIDRRATPRDLLLRQMWQQKEAEVVSSCQARSVELNLSGIKIASAEYSFDGARLMILYSSETEEKIDLKSLRQDMQKVFSPSLVEMRQVGPRDVAKVMCGMGACGLEKRCCCAFLTEFSSISIRMAKEQGISLTPSEITGMCGRLRCCLIYEYDQYVDARQKLPKRNKRVRTPLGEGKVVDVIPLRGSVMVDVPEVGRREFTGEEINQAEEAAQAAAQGQSVVPPAEVRKETETEQPDTTHEATIESGEAWGEPANLSNPEAAPGQEQQTPRRSRRQPRRESDRKARGPKDQEAKNQSDQSTNKTSQQGTEKPDEPASGPQSPGQGKGREKSRRKKGRRRSSHDDETRA